MLKTIFGLVSNKIAEKVTKATSKATREDPSNSLEQIDGNISIKDTKNELHITRKATTNYW